MSRPQSLAPRGPGDIAASIPGSAAIFHRHNLDFCSDALPKILIQMEDWHHAS
jgi:iron-sulfur cluster repair protein YtfE (RIC family)